MIPEADAALFEAMETTVRPTPQRRVERVRANINDDGLRRRRLVAAFPRRSRRARSEKSA